MPSNRRRFMQKASAVSIGALTGVSELGGRALAIPAGGDDFPLNNTDTSQITRNEFGIDYQYTTSVGLTWIALTTLSGLTGAIYGSTTITRLPPVRTTKSRSGPVATVSKPTYSLVTTWSKSLNLTPPNQVSTGYYGNADWGIGMTEDVDHSYSWASATVDTIWALVDRFDPLVSSVTTANDIVSYWKKASKDGEQSDGIRNEWTRLARKKTSGHYMRFFISFPPAEEMSVDYVDISVTDSINDTLFENNGDDVPTIDYSMNWGLSHGVLSRPSSMSTSEKQEYGITKQLAGEVTGIGTQTSLNPDDTVWVAEQPPVKVKEIKEG